MRYFVTQPREASVERISTGAPQLQEPQTLAEDEQEAWNIIAGTLDKLDLSTPLAQSADSHASTVANFLHCSGIYDHVHACRAAFGGCTMQELYSMLQTCAEPIRKKWRDAVDNWLVDRMKTIRGTNHILLKEVIRDP